MKESADNTPIFQAKRLLEILKTSSAEQAAESADDLLLFCYRLLDEYVIVRSTSPRFAGRTFNSLRDVVYQLESDPTAALQRPEWSEILKGVLEDIVTGRIVTARKQGSTT